MSTAAPSFAARVAGLLGLNDTQDPAQRVGLLKARLAQLAADREALVAERTAVAQDAAEHAAAGKAPDGTKFAALTARADGIDAAIVGLQQLLSDAECDEKAAAIRAVVAEVRAVVAEDARAYATLWAVIAAATEGLRRMGSVGPTLHNDDALSVMAPDTAGPNAVRYTPRARSMMAKLEAIGGSVSDLGPIAAAVPFGNDDIPIDYARRAIAKLVPGLADFGRAQRTEAESAAAAERQAAADLELRKAEWHAAVETGIDAFIQKHQAEDLVNNRDLFLLAGALQAEAMARGIEHKILRGKFVAASNDSRNPNPIWSANRNVVATYLAWPHPIPPG